MSAVEATAQPVEIDGVRLVGPGEVAAMFGVKRSTVYTWLSVTKILPVPFYVSGHPLWPAEVIEDWGVETGRLVYKDLTSA